MAGERYLAIRGLEGLAGKLDGLSGKVGHAVARALSGEAEDIMAESKERVPVDLGTLRASGHVQAPQVSGSMVSVTLGYGGPAAPYALAVHENPRSGKTGGVSPSGRKYKTWAKVGGYKFLESAADEAARGIGERVAAEVKAALR